MLLCGARRPSSQTLSRRLVATRSRRAPRHRGPPSLVEAPWALETPALRPALTYRCDTLQRLLRACTAVTRPRHSCCELALPPVTCSRRPDWPSPPPATAMTHGLAAAPGLAARAAALGAHPPAPPAPPAGSGPTAVCVSFTHATAASRRRGMRRDA